MKKSILKIFSMLLVTVMLLSMMPLSSFAANEIMLDRVGVGDLEEPSVSEWPSNDLTVLGRGFSLDTSVNKYETIYTGDYTAMEKYYVINGVGFYNKTTRTWLDYNHTFEYGYTYVAYVYLKADAGYYFNTTEMTAKINGKDATVIYDEKEPTKKLCITAEFYCDITNVSLIMVDGVKAPVAGQTPADYSVKMVYPDYYTLDANRTGYVNGIRWVDESGRDMRANSIFKEGVEYRLQIAVVPVQKYGSPLCSFDYSISAMINGVMLDSPGSNGWDEVYWASSYLVYIYYTLPAAVAAPVVPEPEPPAVETAVGDLNGDGVINAKDSNLLARVVVGTYNDVIDESIKLVADINGDGKLNPMDLNLLKRKLAGF